MKRLIVSLCLSLLCFNSFAYRSIFGQNTTAWRISWRTMESWDHDSFYVQKDTLVNAIAYRKVLSSVYYWSFLLREDTTSGKVWYRNINDSVENLVFDLSLQKGDSFNVRGANEMLFADTVETVDSVFYLNGLKHIQFNVPSNKADTPFFMIEGIGGTYSVLWKTMGIMVGDYMLHCAYKDGVNVYSDHCYPNNIQKVEDKDVDIYPLPANDYLYIRDEADKVLRVDICDALGRLYGHSKGRATIDVSDWNNGLYIANITLKNGTILKKKIIVSH
jgi:hypothetical protein